jgi:choline dehydrogenase
MDTRDVVIVGGGTAGAVLAARLSEDPARTVTLIESGPDYRLNELPAELRDGAATELDPTTRDHNWVWAGYPARGSARQPILGGRVTGGGSAINGQVFLRGTRADFDLWAEEAGDTWSFEAVLPFYQRAETDLDFGSAEWHGSRGPVPVRRFSEEELLAAQVRFREACIAAGFPTTADHNAPHATGVGVVPVNNLGGVRMSTALCYLEAARDRPNLKILDRTTATRVLISGQRTCGVEVNREDSGALERILADLVIVSAGSVGSVLLMVQSGLGPAQELRPPGSGRPARSGPEPRRPLGGTNELACSRHSRRRPSRFS